MKVNQKLKEMFNYTDSEKLYALANNIENILFPNVESAKAKQILLNTKQ